MSNPLSDTRIRNEIAKSRGGEERMITDSSVVGLYLRLNAAGGIWFFRYSAEGSRRKMGLGKYPEVSLAAAREKARLARVTLAEKGDPARERRASEERRKASETEASCRHTLRSLFELWHRKESSRNWKDGGAEIRRLFEKDVLPRFEERFADTIRRRDVIEILDQIKDRGSNIMANRALRHLSAMFRFAAMREIVAGDPTFGITRKAAGGREKERDRYLKESEVRELAEKLPGSGLSAQATASIWVLLSTLARVGELSRARRTDFDLDGRLWKIPPEHAKNEEEHFIHLSDFAIRHVQELLRASRSSVWLLPNFDGTNHLHTKALQKQFRDRQRSNRIKGRSAKLAALQLEGGEWRAHDLRRTGATLMGELGVDDGTIERALNHKGTKLKRTYQRQQTMAARAEAFRLLGEKLALLSKGFR